MAKGSNLSKRGRAKPSPVIVVDYGLPLPTLAEPDHKADQIDALHPGTVITEYKTKEIDADRWIEVDQGWIFVGVTGKGPIKDPAVLEFGKHSRHLTRVLARLPSLRGYSYGRSVDFPTSANGPERCTNTGTKEMDCSSFTWCFLAWAYRVDGIGSYKRHQLIDTPDPWAAITNAKLMNVAKDTGDGVPYKDGIYLCQTWLRPDEWRGGHQFILIVNGPKSYTTLQASSHPDNSHAAPVWRDGTPAHDVYTAGQEDDRRMEIGQAVSMKWAKLKDCDPFGGV